ncbi:MAG: nitrile hydratase accessory protein [Hyphomicrobiales bacterium]
MKKNDAQIKADNEILQALPELPRDEAGPVFAEPWQAQIFAVTCVLHEKGLFTAHEWGQALGGVIKELDDEEEYYQCWLTTLERITSAKGLVDAGNLRDRYNAWDRAARATPHGEPIELGCEE